MDVRHLPLEHPGTYKELRHIVVDVMLPSLAAVAAPALPLLPDLAPNPPALPKQANEAARAQHKAALVARKLQLAARTLQLLRTLLQQHGQLTEQAFQALAPRQGKLEAEAPRPESKRRKALAEQDDPAESRWDLVLWLVDGLLATDFPNKDVAPGQRAGAPFYLYRLAQKLAEGKVWHTPHAARCLQEVLFELSAEHSREKLQAYYGLGGDDSINHITKALRPVDRHQNGALHLLKNRSSLPQPASLVVGQAFDQQEFAIRQVLRRWHIPVAWLMNWTAHLGPIRQALAGRPAVVAAAGGNDDLAEAVSDDSLGTSLATNKDVYLSSPEATERKLTQVLQQLADLHLLGGASSVRVELGDLLDRLEQEAEDDSPGTGASSGGGPGGDAPLPGALGSVLGALDAVKHRFVRVGVALRLLKRLPVKADRLALGKLLVAWWAQPGSHDQGLFDRLGVKPGIATLTDAVLARASDTTPMAFKQLVAEATAALDEAHTQASLALDAQ